MADPDRYTSLVTRQKHKLDYAVELLPIFERAVDELGANPSNNELARWLNANEVKPSGTSKPHAKWTAQTVTDWIAFDGIEPSDENLRIVSQAMHGDNKGSRSKRLRVYGFRISAKLMWRQVEATVRCERGHERCTYEEERLEQHLLRVSNTANALRAALRRPC